MPSPLIAHQGVGAPVLVADRRGRLDAVAFLFGTVAPRPALCRGPVATAETQRVFWCWVAGGAAFVLAAAAKVLWIETVAQATMLFACSVAVAMFLGSVKVERIWATRGATSPAASRPE